MEQNGTTKQPKQPAVLSDLELDAQIAYYQEASSWKGIRDSKGKRNTPRALAPDYRRTLVLLQSERKSRVRS